VSRIQDILAKAERDGMTRRTQADPIATPATPLAGPVIAPVNGTAALDSTRFIGTAPPSLRDSHVTDPRVNRPGSPGALEKARPASAPTTDTRVARATLHPALVAAIAPHSTVAERYRAMRARLTQQEEAGSLRSLAITSPGQGDGKSVTAANLALTMAQEFQRNVVLVDGNLRHSSVHELFGLDEGPGLADVLAGDVILDAALVYLPEHRLTILPAGGKPQFPTELLGSTAMRRTIDTLRTRFDRILIDLPPVLPLADTGTVAPLADGIVMVVRAGVTLRPALDEALGAFEEEKVIGVLLNDAN
jgi:non-specific protein-tyrosine kinase